ncbi:MAG: hypothetical protein WCC18_19610 [Candidatus Acidiferrales bacterium]
MPDYLGALDQGTTSTRFIVFDRSGRPNKNHSLMCLPTQKWDLFREKAVFCPRLVLYLKVSLYLKNGLTKF